jgi:CubicO group peptidase (beta-lactamase class C family)
VDALEADPRVEPHGLIVHRRGVRIAEGYWAPHTPERLRLVYSVSKTFTGTALALALGEGVLSLDDLVADHLPELFGGDGDGGAADGHGPDDRARRMRIWHIASMATGHDREIWGEATTAAPDAPLRAFFRIPATHEPGTFFAYNQPPVYALSAILQRRTGMRLADYLRPRLLDLLGIEQFRWRQLHGIDLGFSGVHTTLDAVARLGQLYLDDGVWGGARLLPEGWVADASRSHVANAHHSENPDWRQGYGFQLWRSQHGYRGDGAFGQYMVVLPDQDAVVALFSCAEDMQVVMDLIWDHLLPAMADDAPTSTAADERLAERLRTLSSPTAVQRRGGRPVTGSDTTRRFTPVAGPSHRTVTAAELRSNVLTVHEGDRSFDLPLHADWTTTGAMSTSAAELDDGSVVVDLVLLDTPHRIELTLDVGAGTFAARWPVMPLFGAGIDRPLASMRAPEA